LAAATAMGRVAIDPALRVATVAAVAVTVRISKV